MPNAGTVNVNLVAQTTAFHSAMEKAEGALHSFHSTVDAGMHLLEAYLGYEAIKHVAEWIHQTMEAVEHQTRLADSLGVSTQAMQELTFSAQMFGVGSEQLGASMLKMEGNLSGVNGEAAKTKESLAAMGMTIADLQGKSGDQQLYLIADGLRNVSTSGDRARIMVDLFGKSGAQMLPMLLEGSERMREQAKEADELGLAFDRVDAQKIIAANEALKVAGDVIEGALIAATKELSPLIEGVVNLFIDAAKNAGGFGVIAHEALGHVIEAVDALRQAWKPVEVAIGVVAAVMAASMTEEDLLIRSHFIWPLELAYNAIMAIIRSADAIVSELGNSFRLVGAEVTKFFVVMANGVASTFTALGNAMVESGIKGGSGFQTAGTAIRQAMNGASVAAQLASNDAKEKLRADAYVIATSWHNIFPNWSDTAIPGLTAAASKMRSICGAIWTDINKTFNTPFDGKAFHDWATRLIAVSTQHAQMVAEVKQRQSDEDKATMAADLALDTISANRFKASLDERLLDEQKQYEKRISNLKKYHDEALLSDAEFKLAEQRATKEHQQNLATITVHEESQVTQWEVMNGKEKIAFTTNVLNNLATLMQSHNKKAFEIGKMAAYASTVINTAQAAMEAYKALAGVYLVGPVLGAAAAAAAIVAGGVQLANIASTTFEGGGSVGGGGFSSSPTSTAGSIPMGPTITTPGMNSDSGTAIHIDMSGISDDGVYSGKFLRNLVDAINDAQENGSTLETVGTL